jgi:hypothetical protein
MNRKEIRKWMIDANLTQGQIAREARVSRTMVSLVISGQRKHKLVTVLLKGHGCPEEYLEPHRNLQ